MGCVSSAEKSQREIGRKEERDKISKSNKQILRTGGKRTESSATASSETPDLDTLLSLHADPVEPTPLKRKSRRKKELFSGAHVSYDSGLPSGAPGLTVGNGRAGISPLPHPLHTQRSLRLRRMFKVKRSKTADPMPVRSQGPSHGNANRIRGRKLTTSKSETIRYRKEWLAQEGQLGFGQAMPGSEGVRKQMAEIMLGLGESGGPLEKEQVRSAFSRLVGNMEDMLFDKIFALFDVDDDGFVERDDFLISIAFLSQMGSTTDNIELAFRLFDVDANGSISQSEFNTMVCAILGNRLKYALQTDYGRQAFKDHMKREWSAESVEFWETVVNLCNLYEDHSIEELYDPKDAATLARKSKSFETPKDVGAPKTPTRAQSEQQHHSRIPKGIPLSVAQAVFERYIAAEAPDQINIGSNTHENIVYCMKNARDSGEETVPIECFKQAAREIMQLMEQDNFERFREGLARDAECHLNQNVTKNNYAKEAWGRFGLSESEGLTLEQFRQWANDNPGYFNFLEEIQENLKRLMIASCDSAIDENMSENTKVLREKRYSSSENPIDCGHLGRMGPPRSSKAWSMASIDEVSPCQPADITVDGLSGSHETCTMSCEMPRRMYHRALTSLVSLSMEEDEEGNAVRVITLGLQQNRSNSMANVRSEEDLKVDKADLFRRSHSDRSDGSISRNYPLEAARPSKLHIETRSTSDRSTMTASTEQSPRSSLTEVDEEDEYSKLYQLGELGAACPMDRRYTVSGSPGRQPTKTTILRFETSPK